MFRRNKTGQDHSAQDGKSAARSGAPTNAAPEDDIRPVQDAVPTPPLGGKADAVSAPKAHEPNRTDAVPPGSAPAIASVATGNSAMTSPADSSNPTPSGSPTAASPTPQSGVARSPTPAVGGLGRPTAPTAPNAAVAAPAGAPAAAQDKAPRQLFVGREIEMAGEISTCDELVVEGRVEARVAEGKSLQIAECGEVKGNVTIDQADIAGLFEGELTVQGRLTVRSTGRIRGTVAYADLAVEAGGKIRGELRDLGDDDAPSKKPAASAAKAAKPADSGNVAAARQGSDDKQPADAAAE